MPAKDDSPEPLDLALTQRQIRAAQGGDGDALDRLFMRYLPRVRGLAAARLGRTQKQLGEIDDLVQETLSDALLALDRFDCASDGLFIHWLAQITENNIRDHLRRGQALKRGGGRERIMADLGESSLSASLLEGREPAASQIARGRELEDRVEQALLCLGARYREVIALRVHGGMSYRDIAQTMGLPSENTANALFVRARHRLRELLD